MKVLIVGDGDRPSPRNAFMIKQLGAAGHECVFSPAKKVEGCWLITYFVDECSTFDAEAYNRLPEQVKLRARDVTKRANRDNS